MSDFTEYVLGFAFDPARERVLLIRKKKPDWQAGKLNGIGGKVESTDEWYVAAMIREFKEETGLDTDMLDWRYLGRMTGPDWSCHVFDAELSSVFEARSTTHEKIHLIYVHDLPFLTTAIANLNWLIALSQNKDFSSFEVRYGPDFATD